MLINPMGSDESTAGDDSDSDNDNDIKELDMVELMGEDEKEEEITEDVGVIKLP